VIVENRTGATATSARTSSPSPRRRHTFLLSDVGALAINPSVYASMPFDPGEDFSPIVMVSYLAARAGGAPVGTGEQRQGADRLRQANPGKMNFVQLGTGRRAAPRGRRIRGAHRHQWAYHPLQGRLGGVTDVIAGNANVAVQRHARNLSVRERPGA